MKQIAYTWEVDNRKALNPDMHEGAKTFVECNRGTHPNHAVLVFRKTDADAIMAKPEPFDIVVTRYEKEDNGDWVSAGVTTFVGYYPESSRSVDGIAQQVIEVTFVDARTFLAETAIRKRYNIIIELEPEKKLSDETKNIATGFAYTVNEVVQELLTLAPNAAGLANVFGSARLDNFAFDGISVASALEQLLITQGRAYCLNPFTGNASAESLTAADSLTEIVSARTAKRLIGDYTPTTFEQVSIDPIPWSPTPFEEDINLLWPTAGVNQIANEDGKVVLIYHCDVSTTGVSTAALSWYRGNDDPLDQVFHGIVQQPPSPLVSHCRWEFAGGKTTSRFRHVVERDVPWIKAPVSLERSDSDCCSVSTGSDKSSAIVPATWTPGGYTALFTTEAPDVRFEEIVTVKVSRKVTRVPIDSKFVEVCQSGTIQVCGIAPSRPAFVGASIKKGSELILELSESPEKPLSIVVKLTAIRRGFSGLRFPNRTQEQFEANERFLQSAYPGAGR